METPAARVARGAHLLDENWPGWERKIDLSTLDIGNSCKCVCGQALDEGWGTWMCARDSLVAEGLTEADYGFNYDADLDAWVSLIKTRFDLGILSDSQ